MIQFIDDAAIVELTNKTDDVIAVDWTKIVFDLGRGIIDTPRPDIDLGWVAVGATLTARLAPIPLPQSSKGVAPYRLGHVELDMPMIIRHQPRVYRFHFTTTVSQL